MHNKIGSAKAERDTECDRHRVSFVSATLIADFTASLTEDDIMTRFYVRVRAIKNVVKDFLRKDIWHVLR